MIRPKGFPGLPEGWTSDWETFPSADGKVQLFRVTHHRAKEAAGKGGKALLILHGFGEHGGRYLHVPHYLKDTVDTVSCLDLRGHGRSEGLRGHVERFDSFADDAALAIRRLESDLKKRHGRSEIHLLGHSMGGHVALRVLFTQSGLNLASAQVTAPFLAVKAKVPAFKLAAARVLAKTWSTLQLPTGLDARLVSRDPAVVEAYTTDRLVHGKMTPRMFEEIERACADTISRDGGIQPPLQMLIPLADGLVDPEVSLEFFRNLKHRAKKLKTYPGFFHEILNEAEKAQVFADVASWIEAHTAQPSAQGSGGAHV